MHTPNTPPSPSRWRSIVRFIWKCLESVGIIDTAAKVTWLKPLLAFAGGAVVYLWSYIDDLQGPVSLVLAAAMFVLVLLGWNAFKWRSDISLVRISMPAGGLTFSSPKAVGISQLAVGMPSQAGTAAWDTWVDGTAAGIRAILDHNEEKKFSRLVKSSPVASARDVASRYLTGLAVSCEAEELGSPDIRSGDSPRDF